ncbi:MAG: bifunctional adenosylcobinamide kinase/adenosylcobinamide-phosphate guanylyltransferase [Turicibacter sp.]
MINLELYFGGAYNGKLRVVKEIFNLSDEDIFYCCEGEIDFNKKVISGIERFIYFNAMNQVESLSFFETHLEQLEGKIIISDEVSSGIVPLKKEERFFREETGRVLQLLSANSTKVVRVFCGIPMVLKDE